MKKLNFLGIILLFVLAGCIGKAPAPSLMDLSAGVAAVELDADINGAVDEGKGGTNAITFAQAIINLGVDPAGTDNSGTSDIAYDATTWDGNINPTTKNTIRDKIESLAVDDFFAFYNGTFQESFNALVTSDGVTITMNIQNTSAGDLTMRFSDGRTILDCTPAATIALTAGTNASPQTNYVYVLQSTKALTLSTTGWPAAEHIRVGFFYVQTAVTVQTYGTLINQNWNDFAANDIGQGHLSHMGQWMRAKGANWFSGCDGGGTSGYITPYAGGASIQVNAGIIKQVHSHSYPSHDTSTTDVALVPNYPADPFKVVNDLNDLLVDANGVSLTGRYYNIILGGIANKGGEYSPLMVKLPTCSYNSADNAIKDVDTCSDQTMPREFNKESSTGFLMARITVRNQSDTTFTIENTQTLLGQDGATAAGSIGGTVLTEFADSQFAVYNNVDASKKAVVDASGIATGTIVTVTVTEDVTLKNPDDTAYNATSWDANTDAPTKNTIRDKFESLGTGGDMTKVVYDTDNDTKVDVSEAVTADANVNVVIKMGDVAGVYKISFVDSTGVEVAYLDSNGKLVALEYGTSAADGDRYITFPDNTITPTAAEVNEGIYSEANKLHIVENGTRVGTVAAIIASGTSALGIAAIADGACATVVTTTATGTATTDAVDWGFNGTPAAVTGYNPASDLVYIVAYPSANNVNFLVCNKSGSAITPGAVTLNWSIRR